MFAETNFSEVWAIRGSQFLGILFFQIRAAPHRYEQIIFYTVQRRELIESSL